MVALLAVMLVAPVLGQSGPRPTATPDATQPKRMAIYMPTVMAW